MFLPAHAVQALAAFLKDYLQPSIVDDYDYDPNDFIILHSFVLPDLEAALETGIETDDLLDKGWMLTAGMIPVLLKRDLPAETYGVLARAMQLYFLACAVDYISYIPNDCYRENHDNINRYISMAFLNQKPDLKVVALDPESPAK